MGSVEPGKTMLTKLGFTDYDDRGDPVGRTEKAGGAGSVLLMLHLTYWYLDEPTNHLDSATADWLRRICNGFRSAL